MAFTPRVQTSITITSKDINGNSIAKTFNNVLALNLDYAKGMLNVVDDVQGSLYFSLAAVATVTYTAVTSVSPVVHTVTIS